MVKYWWTLIRGWNVLFVMAIPLILHFGFLEVSESLLIGRTDANGLAYELALNSWDAIFLALSIGCIAAAGNIINDIHDQHADQVNKPNRRTINLHISEETGIRAFGGFSIAGMLFGAVASYQIDQLNYLFFHAISISLLWLYAMDFKGRLLLGNLIVGLLAGLNVWLIVVYDFLPAGAQLSAEQMTHFVLISGLAVFAILVTVIREIVKDLEDREGDRRVGYRTIGTQLSLNVSKIIISAFSAVVLLGLGRVFLAWQTDTIASNFVLYALFVPFTLLFIFLLRMKETSDFKKGQNFLKGFMLLGLLSPTAILIINLWIRDIV